MFEAGSGIAALVYLLPLLASSAACARDYETDLAGLAEASTLTAAPMHATVGGAMVALDAHVWRDMMPGDLPRGLILKATLRSVGGPFPDGVTMDRAYVIRGDRVWVTPLTDEHHPTGRYEQERMARNGPMWGDMATVERVDVIVRIRPGDGAPVYLSARGEPIETPW